MKSKIHSLPLLGSRFTATVSVALVLFVLGVVGLIGIAAKKTADDIRSHLGFVVILNENATAANINALKARWKSAPYVAQSTFSTADDVLARWNESMSAHGDSLTQLLGVNPFYPEFEIAVKSEYAHVDSLKKIIAPLLKVPAVNEVRMHGDMVQSINTTVNSLTVVLSAVALALLLISFGLISNTVRLTVYARRFIIHAMKLVGATSAFILRPFLLSNFLQGLIAAFAASGALAGALYYVGTLEPMVTKVIEWREALYVFGAMFVFGALICTLSAFMSTSRFLRVDYNDLF